MTDPSQTVPDAPDPRTLGGAELVEYLNRVGRDHLPGAIGIEVVGAAAGQVDGRLTVRAEHRAPNGFLHAAAVVALADTCCGYGCRGALPDGATGFTTIELKSNFLASLSEGTLGCSARLVHGGRTTQVWDAEVSDADSGRMLALFRCTQAVLWPR
jgi:1,4-dihydroxy-2-naphthoyl-CoA hydrolase